MYVRKATVETNVASLNHVCPNTCVRVNPTERVSTKTPIWNFDTIRVCLKTT